MSVSFALHLEFYQIIVSIANKGTMNHHQIYVNHVLKVVSVAPIRKIAIFVKEEPTYFIKDAYKHAL